MPSSDSPSTATTAQPEAAAVSVQTRSSGKGNQPSNASESSAGKEGKQSNGSGKSTAKTQEFAPVATVELTPAQLKKKAKEEKAARRAQAIAKKDVEIPSVHAEPTAAGPSSVAPSTPLGSQQKGEASKGKSQQKTGGPVAASRNLPHRGSQKVVAAPTLPVVPKKEDKTVEFFRHLYRTRTTTIAGAGKDIHPAILALGLQMGNYTVCGSCARLVAMLHAFKSVIEGYTTPPGNSLTRHLTSHVLSPQIDFLTSCRPISISMGNAIRWLKLEISKVDVDTAEADAKKQLCDAIDNFIRERIIYADKYIAKAAEQKISDGDVILTYGKSSLVQKTFLRAKSKGRKFRVVVVDSRPLYEGKHLATALSNLGIDVKYCLLNGLSHNIQDVTKVMLGAHAMMSNGQLFARVGSAIVAMEATEADKPVIVLCQTVKFTERVALDSIVHNEIAPADELVVPGGALTGWEDVKRLQICNLMYDVTPAEFIQEIVTEAGNVPPTSVPVLHRMGNESQG